ncbi:hypothetical protein JIN77_11480 [Verrucomicrobiaceae bacterium R5-34]|uniref:DUF4440 domain-containing protein n=1 Tax=Oceaniferula flava TaxID=2800421 RepID=A0AAE2SDP3_9BACT|nr:hypothetical protein [Oceaniferula flavus]MBK1831351.1 hypothetical protein [Verrucomicrobiaceae bacterium R5-34]MBK1854979.1 hypothetical protein [Oceaniferula flavus]MBM1136285.1 hypothetical protein [Oceaniferula flavus]
MKHLTLLFIALVFSPFLSAEETETRLTELDAFWQKVSLAVQQGDFDSYQSTCHPDAVLVSGVKKKSYPLAEALKRWKKEFDDTRDGKRRSRVEFRFSHRYGDDKTAHEEGMFIYSYQTQGVEWQHEYIDLEALLVKKDGQWLLIMEYQKSVSTQAAWEKLAK